MREEFSEVSFIQKYRESLIDRFVTRLKKGDANCILAMPRKAPRMLELFTYGGIDYANGSKIITSKAFDFISEEWFNGKKVLVVDDIIIVGSTIVRMFRERAFLKGSRVLPLAIHKKWFTEKIFEEEGIEVERRPLLDQRAASVFCTEIVSSLAYLNKPYDLDHPILYTQTTLRDIKGLCKQKAPDVPYDISTSFHRSIGKRRFSFIPLAHINKRLLGFLFQKDIELKPDIVKCRIYYDEFNNQISLVPIFVFDLDRTIRPTFSESFAGYNQLIEDILKGLTSTNTAVNSYRYYRLFCYVAEYLYGLAFSLRNKGITREGNNQLPKPSDFLRERDLSYLFGPQVSQRLLQEFDSLYPKTVEDLRDFYSTKQVQTRLFNNVAEKKCLPETFKEKEDPFEGDEEASFLRQAITPYLQENMPSREFFLDKVACIFEGLFLKVEIPERDRIRSTGRLVDEPPRLKRGFNHPQIRTLLEQSDAIQAGDPHNDLRLSVAIDILVDKGVIIPFQKEDKMGRRFRYGENGLDELYTRFFFAEALKIFFTNLKKDGVDSIRRLPLEKILCLMKQKLADSRDHVSALKPLQDEAGLNTVNLELTYWLHGALARVVIDKVGGPDYPWLSRWLSLAKLSREQKKTRVLLRKKDCYEYTDEFLRFHTLDDSMVRKKIPPDYAQLAELLWYLKHSIDLRNKDPEDRTSLPTFGRNERRLTGDDLLVFFSTCFSNESTLEAMRNELRLIFEKDDDRYIHKFDAGYCMRTSLEFALKTLTEEDYDYKVSPNLFKTRLKQANDRINHAKTAAYSIGFKRELLCNKDHLLDISKKILEGKETPRHIRTELFDPLQEKIEFSASSPLEQLEQGTFDQFCALGNLILQLSDILNESYYITQSLLKNKLHPRTKGRIKRVLGLVRKMIEDWNSELSHSDLSFKGGEKLTSTPPLRNVSIPSDTIPPLQLWIQEYTQVIRSALNSWSKFESIYVGNYKSEPWNEHIQLLYSKTDASNYKWIMWYDIKEHSEGEEEAIITAKKAMGEELERVKLNVDKEISDENIEYYPKLQDLDDARFVMTVHPQSIPRILSVIMESVEKLFPEPKFVRVGIVGVDDTHDQLRKDDYGILRGEESWAVPKRIGNCRGVGFDKIKIIRREDSGKITPEEKGERFHTVAISDEVWRQIWNEQPFLGEPVLARFETRKTRRYLIYIFPNITSGQYAKILPTQD